MNASLRLQINSSGAWKNIAHLPLQQLAACLALAAPLAQFLGPRPLWRVANEAGAALLGDEAFRSPEGSGRELARLCAIEAAARKLDREMTRHLKALLNTDCSAEWDWAWDELALALDPPTEKAQEGTQR